MQEEINVAGSWHAPYLRHTLHRIAQREPWETDLAASPRSEQASEYGSQCSGGGGRGLGAEELKYVLVGFSLSLSLFEEKNMITERGGSKKKKSCEAMRAARWLACVQ